MSDAHIAHFDQWVLSFANAWHRTGRARIADHVPPRAHPEYERILRELVRIDLENQIRAGRPARLDDYRGDFPELFAGPECPDRAPRPDGTGAASHGAKTYVLNAVEIRRENIGSNDHTIEKRELAPDPAADRTDRTGAEIPGVGDRVFGFELVRWLGEGSFATVFLAKQVQLADRLVALKLSPVLEEEPRHLARMQHANIVPIYSVHRSNDLQAVCMPYLGSATLDRLLRDATRDGKMPETGQTLLRTLYAHRSTLRSGPAPETVAPGAPGGDEPNGPITPILEHLARADHVETVLWMAARLAEGLDHAHERGILHLDLKPANILVTDEGQPMLLDFNLSVESGRGDPELGRVGGTLPYMSPEQLRAFVEGARAVDRRSDLFSLGVILFEMLTGERPFPARPGNIRANLTQMIQDRNTGPGSPRHRNPHVPRAVDAIVRKLVSPDPARRYQTAADLREDLERQLAHKVLRHAPDRSVRERFGKWRRRSPRASTAWLVGLAAIALLVLPATAIAVRQNQSAERKMQVETAEARHLARDTIREARTVQVLLATQTGDRALLARGIDRGRAVLETYGIGRNPRWLSEPRVARLPDPERGLVRSELGEMLLLMSRGESLRAGDSGDPAVRSDRLRTALLWNRLAEPCYPPGTHPKLLGHLRAELLAALPEEGDRTEVPAGTEAAEYDPYHDGVAAAMAGRSRDALRALVPFTEDHPQHFGSWYVRGRCHELLGQSADSAACWTVCIALEPDMPWSYYNRAAIRFHRADARGADADLTRALRLRPDWPEALMNRAIARKQLKEYAPALADLDRVLDGADPTTRAWFLRAEVKQLAGDADGAARDRAEGMKREPNDELSWSTRGHARMSSDPAAALKDFDAALALNPRSREALINKSVVLSESLDRARDAVAVLDRFLEWYPDHVEARAGRGVVLARIGECARARADAEECFRRDQSAFLQYQIAGLYAQLVRHETGTGAKREALHLLGAALRAGFSDLDTWKTDRDLDPVRGEPEFKRLQELLVGLKLSPRK